MKILNKQYLFDRSNGCSSRARIAVLMIGVSVPLTAWSLSLSDYLNQATVVSSVSQFESSTSNNTSTVQITPNAELVVVNKVVNDDGGDATLTDFSVATNAGALTFDTGALVGTTTTYTADTLFIPPGSYSLTELDFDGYTEGSWSCTFGTVNGDAFDSGSVTLAIGEQTVCTIFNDDIAPVLTLVKTVVNDNGGKKVIDDFDISIDGSEVISGAVTTVTANALINISELDLVSYSEGTWACSDANGLTTTLPSAGTATGTDISLLPGSNVICSITNNDLGIDLSIAKTVDDSTPNIGQIITFSLVVTNAGPDVATNVTVIDPVPAGFTYVGGSLSGGDASSDADPIGGGLNWTLNSIPVGSSATLTFHATVNAP